MSKELKCEKIKRRAKNSTTTGPSPYKCGKPAAQLNVYGDSFKAVAILCKEHQAAAEREGFRVEVVENE